MAEQTAVAQPDTRAEVTGRRRWLILGALLLGMLLAALDQTIVSTALPTIVADLGGLEHLSWVVTSYLLASTVSTPLWGKLGDLYGRKRFFQASIVIFLVGSALSGLSQNMNELIGFRAIQGLGAGGLIVGAQAIIAAVVPPRERGRYMGLMGSVFAFSSVAGPLIGGLFTEQLTWRWVFYINLPIGAAALAIVAAALPSRDVRVKHSVDYLGASVLGAGVSALVLALSWGGTTYPWGSGVILSLLAVSVVLLTLFVSSERGATEPIIPMNLFRSSVFRVGCATGGIVGFAMFGAITFLPLFLQTVMGAGPTVSGLQMAPMMAAVLTMSIWSGRRISKTGRYRPYPIAGTIIMSTGIFLLSTMGTSTPYWQSAIYMLLVGAGLGLTMQVMVLAVQNSVKFNELGVATSSAAFFRSIGGSVGVAVFGTIFANRLAAALPASIRRAGGDATHFTPQQILSFPVAVQHHIIDAFAHSLHLVFLAAVPFAAAGLLLALLLKEVPLRVTTGRGAAQDAVESAGVPESAEVVDEDFNARAEQLLSEENPAASR